MKPARSIKYLLFVFLLSSAGIPLSSYAGPYFVPNLIGETETNAIAILDGDDCCSYGGSSYEDNAAPAGDVIRQAPDSGTEVTPVQTVTLVVSNGPATTTTTTTTTTAAPTTTTTTTAAPTTTTTTTTDVPTTTTTTDVPTTTTTTDVPTTTTTTDVPTTTTTTDVPTTTTTTTAGTTTTTQPGSGTVVINGCDSGVQDPDGIISGMLAKCEGRNHGEYVSCVTKKTSKLKKDGVISGKEKGRIQSCAG